jgi:nucleoid-associated protein YgaU
VCGQYLNSGSSSVQAPAAPATPAQPSAPSAPSQGDQQVQPSQPRLPAIPAGPTPKATGTYVVHPGDSLSTIAAAHHTVGGWAGLARLNAASVPNPDLILSGQKIKI